MASLDMSAAYELTSKKIDEVVAKTSAGNYALGHVSDSPFRVNYVGRSDDDVRGRLKQWVGSDYTSFKFSSALSARAAFEKECQNYHDFGGTEKLDNKEHPGRPDGTSLKCPICGV
jgi:hypothetical protein